MKLKDQVAIITGAGAGIGRASAIRFAQEGAKVAVTDIKLELAEQVVAEIRAAGGTAIAIECNVMDQAQVESMTGVYYPHFVTDCEVKGTLEGEGRNISVINSPNYITTKTDHYRVRREADITFRSIMRPALSKANRKLSDGIHPFPLEKAKPFSDAYLTDFLAERRDIEAESIQPEIAQEVAGYVQPLLSDTVHYESQSLSPASRVKTQKTRYVLLPTWVLTYPNKQKKDEPYYYAMNGCTGEVCGKLPIDRKKLYLAALGVGAAVFAAACVLCYFLF